MTRIKYNYLPAHETIELAFAVMNEEALLNDSSEDELRTLMKLWLSVGGKWNRFVAKALAAKVPFPNGGEFWIPSANERPILVPFPAHGSSHAQGAFLQVVLAADPQKIGGPCPGCRRYFPKRIARDQSYCSRKCLESRVIIPATRKMREKQHARLLELASEAISVWKRRKRSSPWKKWTVAHMREKDGSVSITEKSLTRWVKSGELIDPEKKDGK
jgi:hypothetical protein